MNTVLKSVAEFLVAEKVHFNFTEDEESLWLAVSGKRLNWNSHISTNEDQSILTVLARLPGSAPQAKRTACSRLLAKINHGQRLGGFHLDLADGEVLFCISGIVPGGASVDGIIRTLLGLSFKMMEQGGPEILKLIFGSANSGNKSQLEHTHRFHLN